MRVYMGIDLGTQGCRAIAAQIDGGVLASSYSPLQASAAATPPGWSEQDPGLWWPCVRRTIAEIPQPVRASIDGVSVDSTSGTIVPVRADGTHLANALMYNDVRAEEEARLLSEVGRDLEAKLGYRVKSSFSASKILWMKRNEPALFESAERFLHAADYISSRFTGLSSQTDHTNALKSCFDLIDYRWPDFLMELGIPEEKLPDVCRPGEKHGYVTEGASRQTGIPSGTPVFAGLTDGCASQIASGAAGVGDWETTIGTTMVIKGVTQELIRDPVGRIYSHLHPEGTWMPGGASSTGGECLAKRFPDEDLAKMDLEAKKVMPTNLVVYPLSRRGERFPFVSGEAEGFVLGKPRSRTHAYAGHLEGVACLERLAYEVLEDLGAKVGTAIFTAGGGARSQIWLQVRANVLQKTIRRPQFPDAAMGGAILAASSDLGIRLGQAAEEMVKIDLSVTPDPDASEAYESKYRQFLAELRRRFGVTAPAWGSESRMSI